jgi:hypothetical protein
MSKHFQGVEFRVIPQFRGSPMDALERRAPYIPTQQHSVEMEIDFDEPNAVRRAICSVKPKNGGFRFKDVKAIPYERIPLGGTGRIKGLIKEYSFDHQYVIGISVHQVLHEVVMNQRNLFAAPLAAITYANSFPRRQLENDLVTLFTGPDGRACHVVLSNRDGARSVLVDFVPSLGYKYDKDTRFLVGFRHAASF